jgi:uncharacterized protein YijF (DUF1287 family)
MISRRLFVGGAAANLAAGTGLALLPSRSSAQITTVEPWADKLVKAAESQIGVTVTYDAAYRKIVYPGGDVPREIGVCTDVVVRAYRDGLGIDLQRLVHEDMKKSFSAYPKLWGLASTDRNIDHRRVPNLRTYFQRRGAAVAVSASAADYRPGDIISQILPDGRPHIGIVSNRLNDAGTTPLVIHNIGRGTLAEDILFALEITGHYRYSG